MLAFEISPENEFFFAARRIDDSSHWQAESQRTTSSDALCESVLAGLYFFAAALGMRHLGMPGTSSRPRRL